MQASPNNLPLFSLAMLFVFFAAWCFGNYMNSVLCGWHLLSKRFRANFEFLGQTKFARPFIFDICMRHRADYSNIIRIAAEDDALHLSVVLPFRFAHPPLCIPWEEIQFGGTKHLWRRYVVLKLGNQEHIPMRISQRVARNLGILERIPN